MFLVDPKSWPGAPSHLRHGLGRGRYHGTWVADLGRLILLAAALGIAAAIGIIQVDRSDVFTYRDWGEAFVHGAVPYRDVEIEYPPGALALFVAPVLVTSTRLYVSVFLAMMLIATAFAMIAADRLALELRRHGDGVRLTWLVVTGLVVVLGSVALSRFDAVPAALTVVGLLMLVRDRHYLGGIALGAAIAIKLYPVVALPIAITYVVRRAGARAAATTAALGLGVVAVAYAPFLLLSAGGVQDSLSVQLVRSLEIESLGGALFATAHRIFGTPLAEQPNYYDFAGGTANVVGLISTAIGLVCIVALWIGHLRARVGPASLVRYSAATIAAVIAFGKVLSPQYLLWLVALVPLVAGVRGRVASGLLGIACLLTAVVFPSHWDVLLHQLDAMSLSLIVIRDFLLVGLVVALSWPAMTKYNGRRHAQHLDRVAPECVTADGT